MFEKFLAGFLLGLWLGMIYMGCYLDGKLNEKDIRIKNLELQEDMEYKNWRSCELDKAILICAKKLGPRYHQSEMDNCKQYTITK